MPIFWSIILASGLGSLCGAWMPILPFAVILALTSLGVGLSSYVSTTSIIYSILNGVYVATAMQLSYAAGMFAWNFITKNLVKKDKIIHETEQKLNTDIPPSS